MILNSRQNGFFVTFPPTFFNKQVQEKYEKYYRNLLLPYRNLSDFMSSTIQSIDFPGFVSDLPFQTRSLSKRQEVQSSKPIADMYTREIKLTFKLTDSYLNYFIFMDNALNYLDPANVANEGSLGSVLGNALDADPVRNNNHPYFDPIRLTLLNNEGYAVSSIIYKRPMLKAMSALNLSYSSVSPKFSVFSATFQYYNFDIEMDYD
jgi:hypothetical protein